ncbi:MAG: hypothetical protein Q9162_002555 [Coniocarpon cinnabarinum]
MPRVHFRPLVISKRKWRGPWFPSYYTGDGPEHSYEQVSFDTEKQDTSDWEDATNASSSANSSRVSSASYDSQQTLLDRRKKPRKPVSAYAPLKQCNFYFTVILGAVLVVFVLVLFTLHKRSAAEVSSGIHKPEPKPPPWSEFPRLERYWGGVRNLVGEEEWEPEYPAGEKEVKTEVIEALEEEATNRQELDTSLHKRSLPKNTQAMASSGESTVECFLDEDKTIRVPRLKPYAALPQGFPAFAIGNGDVEGHNKRECLDRYRRFQPYGFGVRKSKGGIGAGVDDEDDETLDPMKEARQIDYRNVEWHKAQESCMAANAHRFESKDHQDVPASVKQPPLRTAILVRTRSDHHYTIEEILQLRAMVAEATLTTGSAFVVHFLIQLTQDMPEIWSDSKQYEEVASGALPNEFQGMGSLWSQQRMEMIYEALAPAADPIYGSVQGAYLPVQEFARSHAEYDHFWVWDLNTRYTADFGSLLESIHQWTEQQPRRELWERNARFYVPSEHGSWDEFSSMIHVLTEHGPSDPFADRSAGDLSTSKSVWGPQPPDDDSNPSLFIDAPGSSGDEPMWGVSEAADFISMSPIFDPTHVSSFPPASDVRGYNVSTSFPPRRATTSNLVRLSRRLLLAMHAETVQRHRHMAPELWPASVALHYGYKAVSVPHAVYVDRKWPMDYLAAVMNTGADRGVVSGRSSVFGEAQRNVFEGLSWGATGGQQSFGRTLWRRWLGYRDEQTGEGGEEWEDANEGRMCLPPMLLGGVGTIDLVVEDED